MYIHINIYKKLSNKNSKDFILNTKFESGNELIVILGPSGAGKTLTLDCIAGLEKPDKGYISINGITYFDSEKKIDISTQNRKVGYLFQNFALFPHLNVMENILFGVKKSKDLKKMLNLFEINGLEKRYPSQLSGGQKQRVALARALIIRPQILLLDEPFSSIDFVMRMRLRRDLRKIRELMKIPIILITHNPFEAYSMADRLVVYKHGGVEQVGTPYEIFRKPISKNVAKLVGMSNIFKGVVIDKNDKDLVVNADKNIIIPSNSDFKIGEKVSLCIRPDRVAILNKKKQIDNLFSGEIIEILPKGTTYLIFVKGEIDIEIEIPFFVYENLSLEIGKEIMFYLKKSDIHVLRES